jgi:hypothetical protein
MRNLQESPDGSGVYFDFDDIAGNVRTGIVTSDVLLFCGQRDRATTTDLKTLAMACSAEIESIARQKFEVGLVGDPDDAVPVDIEDIRQNRQFTPRRR